jgi:hypothetical protein
MRRTASISFLSLLCAVLIASTVGFVSPAGAAPKPGATCPTAGKKIVTSQWIFTCTKKKGKQVWVRKARPTPSPTPTPTPSPTPGNDTEIESLSFLATRGAERPAPPGASALGPWSTGMAISSSSSGASFSTSPSIIDQAGVPSLLALPDGRLLAYFVSWAQRNVMAVGIRDTAGAWVFYRVAVEGFRTDVGGANGVDPSAVLMADGSVRLFWMQPPMGTTGRSLIYSATSAPGSALGVRFVVDPGARLDLGTMVYDPTVAFCGGEWLMWVSAAESTVFATSPDGLAFTQQATPSGLGTAFPWSAACLPDGRMRLLASRGPTGGLPFVGGPAGFAEAGASVLPPGVLPDAGWARLADGTWALAYLQPIA